MSNGTGCLLLTTSLTMAGIGIPAQTNWWLIVPPVSPPSCISAASCHDDTRGRLVIFGGSVGGALLAETWEFDGRTWHQMLPPGSPSPRDLAAMAFDTRRGRGVLFGGRVDYVTGRAIADTWEWDGVVWREVTSSTPVPAARSRHGMVFDTRLQRIVLFGGCDASGGSYSDTWTWDGSAWTALAPSTIPSPRCSPGMAYDRHRQRLVMFGGWGSIGPLFDTWEWDGIDWTRQPPTNFTVPVSNPRMSFDSERRRIVLYPAPNGGTCEWDGTNWVPRATASAPHVGRGHIMEFVTSRRQVVRWSGEFDYGRTWVYGPLWPADFVSYGSGCSGSGRRPQLDVVGLPYLGRTLDVRLSASPSTPALAMVGFTEVNLDLGAFGAPGCALLLSVAASVGMRTDGQGQALLSLAVPVDSELIGRSMFMQYAVQDTTANLLGWITTSGGRATFGAP